MDHLKHYQTYKGTIRSNAKKRRERNKAYMRSRMTPCVECGYFHPDAMDFHHVNDDKERGGVSRMVRGGKSIEAIKEEIDKCICLCSNCHRIHHAT